MYKINHKNVWNAIEKLHNFKSVDRKKQIFTNQVLFYL